MRYPLPRIDEVSRAAISALDPERSLRPTILIVLQVHCTVFRSNNMPSAESTVAIDLLTSVSPISQNPKPFSISLSKPKASVQTTNPRKRPHSSLAEESDSDHGVNDQKQQLVSSFDRSAGGAIVVEGGNGNAKASLVIASQKNRDWRAESSRKRGRNSLPAEEIARREGRNIGVVEDAVTKPQVYGLTVVRKEDAGALQEDKESVMVKELANQEMISSQPMTADEEAVAALMGEQKRKELVLPAVQNEGEDGDFFTARANGSGAYEEDAFKADVASRPDSASLDDYATVPIEEFGAALLRGMGWKEGDVVGKRKDRVVKPRVLERRPQLLGLGAKEVPEGLEEIGGAWGKAAKGKKLANKGFTKLLLKNTKTGELLSEEELKARREQQSVVVDDWRERRERNLKADEGKKEERRERERDEERRDERSRNASSRRERSRSPDRRRDRRRDYRDEPDDTGKQDRNRERRRREEERDSGRDREIGRSSKYEHRSRRVHEDEQSNYRSSKDRHRERDERDDTRSRRRQEVY